MFVVLSVILMASIVTAPLLNSRAEAIALIQQNKLLLDEEVETDDITITILSDKECRINFETEETENCKVRYEATYQGRIYEEKIELEEFSTLQEDETVIKNAVKAMIEEELNKELERDVSYKARDMRGRNFTATVAVIIE